MAVFKATKDKRSAGTTFKATSNRSYDQQTVYQLEEKRKQAITTIDSYDRKASNNEFLDAESLSQYKSAVASYVSSSDRLRSISRYMGTQYTEDDDKKWADIQAGLWSNYDGLYDYFSKWKDTDEYSRYLKEQQDDLESFNFDTVAGQQEIEGLRAKYDAMHIEYEQMLASGTTADFQTAANRKYDLGVLADDITKKEAYLKNATRLQQAKIMGSIGDPESEYYAQDFEQYAVAPEKLTGADRITAYINADAATREVILNDILKPTLGVGDNGFPAYVVSPTATADYAALKVYSHMTDDQVRIYNYYRNKEGQSKALEYLKTIQESLNVQEGSDIAGKYKGDYAAEILFKGASGLDQFNSEMDSFVRGIIGNEEYVPASPTQVAAAQMHEDLGNLSPNFWYNFKEDEWEDQILGESLGQIAGGAAQNITHMVPMLGASTIANLLLPGSGGAVAGAVTFASASGGAYQEAINMGYGKDEARTYGAVLGAFEASLQYLLTGISLAGGKLTGNAVSKISENINNGILRTVVQLAGTGISEFSEEYLQQYLEPVFQNWILKMDNDVSFFSEENIRAGLMGALTALILEGPGTVSTNAKTYQTGKKLQNAGITAQRLAEVGKLQSADSVAYKLAGRVNEKTGAYTMGRLFYELGAEITEKNQADIKNALVQDGMDIHHAETLVEALTNIVMGTELTQSQRMALESNEYLSAAVVDTIIDPNSTVNQRTAGYKDVLRQLANETAAKNTAKNSRTAATPTQSAQNNTAEGTFIPAAETGAEVVQRPYVEQEETAKVRIKSTGQEVTIKEIASVKDGDVTYRMEDGSVVAAADVEYDNDAKALLYETAAALGGNTMVANSLINAFYTSNKVSAHTYAVGIREAFVYGRKNIPFSELQTSDTMASMLTEHQLKVAYAAGQYAAGKEVAKAQALINQGRKNNSGSKKPGTVHFDGDRSKLTERQEAGMKTLETLAKVMGIQVYVFESETDEAGRHIGDNGWYDISDSSIHVDLHAGISGDDTMLFTAAHELTHFIKQWSPAKFKILENFLMQEYGQKGVSVTKLIDNQIQKAQNNGREISRDVAFEEVVADSMESMLADGRVVEKLIRLKKLDRSLCQKILDYLGDLVNKVRSAYHGLKPDSDEGRHVAEMLTAAEKLQDLFTEGLADASDSFTATGQKNTAQEGDESDILFSPRDEDKFKQFSQKVDTVVDKLIVGKGHIDGKLTLQPIMPTGPKITAMIDVSSGGKIDISQKMISIHPGEAWHEYKRHTKYSDEVSRDQVAFTKRQYNNAIKCIVNPDIVECIFTSTDNPTQQQSFAYAKRTDRGSYVVVEAVGGKKNPHIYPVMILQFSKQKWSKMMGDGKTLGEVLYKDDTKMLAALNIAENKKSRVTAAQFASFEAIANTPHSPQLNANITPQAGNVKTFSARDAAYLELAKKPETNRNQLQQMVNEAARATGYTIRAYHGTSRGDRVGNVFLPERATSGPMAFFTSDRTIAERYARDKKDTSLAYDEEYSDYYTQFRINKNGKSIKVQDLWQSLPNAEKQRIKEAGKHLTWDEDMRSIVWDDNATHGLGNWDAYTLNLHKGNAIEALIDGWLESGELWGREGDFVQVLKLAGINGVEYRDPDARHERVYDTFLRIQNPFNTDAVSNEFADGFEEWYQQQPDGKYDRDTSAADMWDKNSQTAESFLERLRDDIDNGSSYAWTSIPDSMTDYLKHLGHDGIQDVGGKNGGESHIVYVPFSSEQVKDASPITYDDKGNVIPLSQRFDSSKSDIRYSTRDPVMVETNYRLERENAKLRDDVSRLQELVKLQGQLTHGTVFTRSSVETGARYLKNLFDSKCSTQELAEILNKVYTYIAKGEDLTWSGVVEAMQPAVRLLQENIRQEQDGYAQDILQEIRGTRVYLNDQQKQNAAYEFGSYEAFRRKMMGTLIVTDNATTSLDSMWQALSEEYPATFARDVSDADQPGELLRVIGGLRDMKSDAFEGYDRRMLEQDIKREIYDSYWRVSTLRTVADRKQAEINRLKSKHSQQMDTLRQTHKENLDALKSEFQESRRRGVDSRRRTEMRHKIKKVVNTLNQMLLSETKDRHIMEELKSAVALALDVVNMDTVGAEDRLAKLEAERAQAKTDTKRQEIEARMNRVRAMGGRLDERLDKLKSAYEQVMRENDQVDDVILRQIEQTKESVGQTALRDMTIGQLEAVHDLYTMVLSVVRDRNKAFANNRRESIEVMGKRVMAEVREAGGKKLYRVSGLDGADRFFWANLKPVYAVERIGSKTLMELFDEVRSGEDTWARDISAAKTFYRDKSKKYHFDSWKMDKQHQFTDAAGKDFALNIEQMMSLYAYSKRAQAPGHLFEGGFMFDPKTEVYVETGIGKNKKLKLKYNVSGAETYRLNPEILDKITATLTEDQKGFVDDMQDYLSATMGAKGNEISMAMYGIKLFKERFYFPLKSAPEFLEQERQKAQGEVKIKNKGFTKKLTKGANNPVILSDFTDVWTDHVNEMSMYHAFTLPLEDFYRVRNYKESVDDSVNATLKNAYGEGAVAYIEQLLKDLNGGAVSDNRENVAKKMTSLFKKAAVMCSLSVVVQQPTALVRAMALVDAKYFGPAPITKGVVKTVNTKRHKAMWNQIKQYAPVAIIKEMGHFDTNMGRSTRDFIKAKEYDSLGEKATALVTDSGYRDEVLSKLPSLADELAWVAIWEAVERETKDKHKELTPGSDAFLRCVGKRFTEVVTKTQVYDSVMARSANMRSKTLFMNMVTSFMAEPTTSINMLEDALRKGMRGDKRYAAKAVGAVFGSVVLNAALASLVYAMRDDDEDETFAEKYLSRLTTEILDGINPLTYIPIIKDVWSIAQGFDVERADMSLVADLFDAMQKFTKVSAVDTSDMDGQELKEHQKKVADAMWSIADAIASMTGIPSKNVRRDINGIFNLFQTISKDVNGRKTTLGSLVDNILEGVQDSTPVWGWLPEKSNRDKLYGAITSGDKTYIARIKAGYKTDAAYTAAVRKALRENDPRIREAAEAVVRGKAWKRTEIATKIRNEGHFTMADIQAAITAEIEKLRKN